MDLFQPDRHESVSIAPWSETAARATISEIASSALSRFDPDKLWPSHPLDGVPDGVAGVYMGAAGVILALDHLKRAGAIDYATAFDALSFAERDNAWLKKGSPLGAYGALLMGDMGAYLVAMRLQPDASVANRVYARAEGNNALPLLEMMWGTPGSMLAACFMHELSGEARFETLYRTQAARLLADTEEVGASRLWTQEMYGRRARYLGLVHGFAGNVHALLKGWRWLTHDEQRTTTDLATDMLLATARRAERRANWPANADQPDAPMLCQICHGAPGIIAVFADAPFSSPDFERILLEGGELVWVAGPLRKGSNFCHGAGGNAYALLKLYKRTRDRKWLHRARAFAMTGISQWRAARAEYGRDRYTLWTGDPGFAVCLWSCITGEPTFPGLDAI